MPNAPSRKAQEFSANVRMGEVETLKEAGSRGAGLRVLIGRRMGASYTSDLTPEGIRQMVRSAVDLAALTTEDPHAGLPDADELGSHRRRSAALFAKMSRSSPTEQKIDAAKRAEAAALAFDPRITNSEGGVVRFERRRPRVRQFARIRGRLPLDLLFDLGRSGRHAGRQHGARLLVHASRAISAGLEDAGIRRPQGRRARAAPAGRGESGNAARARHLRAAHGAHAAGQSLRSRGRPRPSIGRPRSSPANWARRSPTSASR